MASLDRPRLSDAAGPVDPARVLLSVLRAHDLVADLTASERSVVVSAQGRPGIEVLVSCRGRRDDDWQMWFFGPESRPLARTDDLTGAVVAIKGLLADLC